MCWMMVRVTEPRSVEEVLALEGRGESLEYCYFWGHRPLPSGEIGRSCLSQWWECEFTVDGITYASAEHWMMARKARLFGDGETFARVVAAGSPAEAKSLGRDVRDFRDQTWVERRFEIVSEGNYQKFRQNPPLRDYLLGTGRLVLVEASPVDRIWGIGLAADDERARHPAQWQGLNLLGFALMHARSRLLLDR